MRSGHRRKCDHVAEHRSHRSAVAVAVAAAAAARRSSRRVARAGRRRSGRPSRPARPRVARAAAASLKPAAAAAVARAGRRVSSFYTCGMLPCVVSSQWALILCVTRRSSSFPSRAVTIPLFPFSVSSDTSVSKHPAGGNQSGPAAQAWGVQGGEAPLVRQRSLGTGSAVRSTTDL